MKAAVSIGVSIGVSSLPSQVASQIGNEEKRGLKGVRRAGNNESLNTYLLSHTLRLLFSRGFKNRSIKTSLNLFVQ